MEYEGEAFIDPHADISAQIDLSEAQEALRRAMNSLLPQQRELVESVYFRNEKLSDIAKEQGVSKAALSIRMSKIFDRLKKVLR
jgi:RNA polymerase sigma factor (sigma-70 family)